MNDLNRVLISGRLGTSPQLKILSSGNTLCVIQVATGYKSANAETEETTWHRVVIWGKSAEYWGKTLDTGDTVYIEGHLRGRKYADHEGKTRYSYEIHSERMKKVGSSPGRSQRNPVDFAPQGDEPSELLDSAG